jgi:DNA-binding GntR family transcriptional regulator
MVVSELALSKELKVSRTPVHDAVQDLMKDRLIEQVDNHRPYIAKFTGSKVNDLFGMRCLLEAEAARQAATGLDKRALESLRTEIDSFANEMSDEELQNRWLEFDNRFHIEIADGCGNQYLRQDIFRYRAIHEMLNRLYIVGSNIKQGLKEHEEILVALEARDGDAAAEAMANHIGIWTNFFARAVDRDNENSE